MGHITDAKNLGKLYKILLPDEKDEAYKKASLKPAKSFLDAYAKAGFGRNLPKDVSEEFDRVCSSIDFEAFPEKAGEDLQAAFLSECIKNSLNRIKEIRYEKRMSQKELAGLIGVRQQDISRWEVSGYLPEYHTCFKIARALGVTLEELTVAPAK